MVVLHVINMYRAKGVNMHSNGENVRHGMPKPILKL